MGFFSQNNVFQYFLLSLVGTGAGFLNVIAGGGSLLTMPLLILLGMDGVTANGTNRVAIFAQAVTANSSFIRKGVKNLKRSFSLALCTLPGAFLGALLGTRISGTWFNRILACVMLFILILMSGKKKKPDEFLLKKGQNVFFAHILMMGAGFYGGFIQVGIGLILMAIIHKTLFLDLIETNAHKVFIIGSYTLLALPIFAFHRRVDWIAGIFLALGNSLGGWLGVRFSIKKGEGGIRLFFNIIIIVLALKLLLS